jgi:hypothetical protein
MKDQRFQKAVVKLLNIALTNPRTQNDTTDALRDLARQFDGEAFGAPPSLQRERKSLNIRIKRFHQPTSPWYHLLQERGLAERRFPELVAIIDVLADCARLSMNRECRRRKSVLFGWVDSHWAELEPFLHLITLEFEGGQRVTLKDSPH